MAPLSLCVIARDSARLLPDCLISAHAVASDVVVVVDDRTRDDTASIARSLGARVFTHSFTDFASQKNFCLSQAKHDWVLFLDADEQLSPELSQEINHTLANPVHSAYIIPRLNYIFGKVMHHTNWDPSSDAHVWLFDGRRARWTGIIHEQVVTSGSIGRLLHPKIHHNYSSVESFIEKLNLYTSFEAKKRSYPLVLVFLHPVWKFIRHFFVHLGFLDGWHGLFLSYLQAIYGLTTAVKTWEQRQNLA